MWLDNLKELKKRTGLTAKQIADKSNLPERTVNRVLSGDTEHPYMDTIRSIVVALDGSLDDIFADTKVVVVPDTIVKAQEYADAVTAERDMILAENTILKDKVATLTAEIELLRMQLKHKEEIISIHNYYNKLKSSD